MSMQEVSEGNEFTAFWNNVLVAKFERFRNILLEGLSYHSEVPLRTLELAKGAKVLDVGCGWGDTAIQLAKLTGPTGSVLGLDCCDAFLQKGRTDAAAAGLSNVRFVVADVETYRFEPEYDLCFSRFGMMFFSNPVAAMRNVRTALKPGGRLLFITWRPIGERGERFTDAGQQFPIDGDRPVVVQNKVVKLERAEAGNRERDHAEKARRSTRPVCAL